MQNDADEKPQTTWPDACESLGEDVDRRALELKLQIVRQYFKEYGSVPAFHNFKDLAHLRASLTFTDPIDRRIKAKIDDAIRARMAVRLGSTSKAGSTGDGEG